MDLVDLIQEKRFLGQEFLAWLWYKSEERGGSVEMPGFGDILVVFEKHMLLEYGEGEANEKVICRGLQTELREARTGLALGKKPEQARIKITKGEYEFHLTLAGACFEFRNVRLPKTVASSDESDDPEAVEGRILERISLFEELSQLINDLFSMFLKKRIGEEWTEELGKIQNWTHKGMDQS
jgi:recombination associated protein RdgC